MPGVIRLNPDAVLYDKDGNVITSIQDPVNQTERRLQVESRLAPGTVISVDAVPANPGNAVRDFLRNGGSRDMNVDGSGGDIAFTFDADSSKDIFLTEVRFIFNAQSINMKGEDFGSDLPLTNGTKFEVTTNGTTTELANFKINEDFLALPSRSGINMIYDGPANDQIVASFYFGGAVCLKAGTGDNVKITVRDELTIGGAHKVVLFWGAVYGIKSD